MISTWARQTFESLANRHFRHLWIGTLFIYLAWMTAFTVQSVLAFELGGTNRAVGLIAMANGLAMFFVSPFGGVIADRVNKRPLLMVTQTMFAVAFLAIGSFVIAGAMTLTVLMLLTFLNGLALAFAGPARRAYIGDLVPREQLGNAVALGQLAMSAPRLIGPFVAAILLGTAIGIGGTYLMIAALSLVPPLTLIGLPGSRPGDNRSRSVLRDLMDGLRHIRDRPRLRTLMLTWLAFSAGGATSQTVLPGFLEHELSEPARSLGYLVGVASIAGVTSTVVLAGFIQGRRAWTLMIALALTMALSLCALALAPSLAFALAVMLPLGAGMGGYQVIANALIMTETDPAYFGRVMSITLLGMGSQGLAALPIGMLADLLGERAVLQMQGLLVAALIALVIPAYRALRAQEAPTSGSEPPVTRSA